jgi:20S proteasome subunit beta 7
MQKVGQHTLIGASGDLSDYQKIMSMVQETQTYDMAHDDGCSMTPKDYHQYLGRIMYNRSPSLLKLAPILCSGPNAVFFRAFLCRGTDKNNLLCCRRNKFDPLWNELVVAGFRDGKPFLGALDMIGTMYEDEVIATGFGNYVCLPLLRKAGTDLSKEDAKKVLEDSLRVLFYRNTKSSARIQISTVTAAGVEIGEPYELSTYWGYEAFRHTEYHGQKRPQETYPIR